MWSKFGQTLKNGFDSSRTVIHLKTRRPGRSKEYPGRSRRCRKCYPARTPLKSATTSSSRATRRQNVTMLHAMGSFLPSLAPVDSATPHSASLSGCSLRRHSSRVRAVCVNALVRICAGGDQRWSSLPRQLTHYRILRWPGAKNSSKARMK
jgi:hypothetical protein